MYFEIASDIEVTIDGIGMLAPGFPVVVDEFNQHMFKALHGVDLMEANFPPYVQITAVLDVEKEGE